MEESPTHAGMKEEGGGAEEAPGAEESRESEGAGAMCRREGMHGWAGRGVLGALLVLTRAGFEGTGASGAPWRPGCWGAPVVLSKASRNVNFTAI